MAGCSLQTDLPSKQGGGGIFIVDLSVQAISTYPIPSSQTVQSWDPTSLRKDPCRPPNPPLSRISSAGVIPDRHMSNLFLKMSSFTLPRQFILGFDSSHC